MKSKFKYLIGIDEVGRGPLAGPVVVGVVVFQAGFNEKLLKGIKDSKKLTLNKRVEWFKKLDDLKRNGEIDYIVSFSNASVIDKKGIAKTINNLIERSLFKLNLPPKDSLILLDGGLKAPLVYKNQETIVKGDEKEVVISSASIMAKVTRDNRMVNHSFKYKGYGFERNMGYGTKEHINFLKKVGPSSIHRLSYIKNFY